jgi:hypothetical protein
MLLTNEQIEMLFAFTRKKFVRGYDLQVELVDHLASNIEEEMSKDAKLSFDAALQKVYAGFGLFGFAHVVQERAAALEKQHHKLWRKIIWQYFTLPKVTLAITIFLSAYYVAPILPSYGRLGFLFSLFVACVFISIRRSIIEKREMKYPLMLTQYTPYIPFSAGLVGYISSHAIESPSTVGIVVFSLWTTGIIIFQLAEHQILKQIRQKAKELYPEAFSVA